MKNQICFLSVAAAVLSPAMTKAQFAPFQPDPRAGGWFAGADLGGVVAQDSQLSRFANLSLNDRMEFGAGIGMDVYGGYAFNQYLAVGGTVGWTWNPINSIGGASVHDTSFSSVPFMANVVLQYPIAKTRIIPYIGAGVGGALTVFDSDGYTRYANGNSVTIYDAASDFVFAWQAFAGVRVELNDNLSVGIGYRYLWMDSSSYSFEPDWYYGSTVRIGMDSVQSHLAALTFTMKF